MDQSNSDLSLPAAVACGQGIPGTAKATPKDAVGHVVHASAKKNGLDRLTWWRDRRRAPVLDKSHRSLGMLDASSAGTVSPHLRGPAASVLGVYSPRFGNKKPTVCIIVKTTINHI